MDAKSMEKELVEFLTRDLDPINIGKLYGQDFPIYPGEVVILQAPPKSMKTMLLQNWVNSWRGVFRASSIGHSQVSGHKMRH